MPKIVSLACRRMQPDARMEGRAREPPLWGTAGGSRQFADYRGISRGGIARGCTSSWVLGHFGSVSAVSFRRGLHFDASRGAAVQPGSEI